MEIKIRKILINEQKSPRLKLITQNLSSKFMVYNNLWKKKMNEIESGVISRPQKSSANAFHNREENKERTANHLVKEINVNLNIN